MLSAWKYKGRVRGGDDRVMLREKGMGESVRMVAFLRDCFYNLQNSSTK